MVELMRSDPFKALLLALDRRGGCDCGASDLKGCRGELAANGRGGGFDGLIVGSSSSFEGNDDDDDDDDGGTICTDGDDDEEIDFPPPFCCWCD